MSVQWIPAAMTWTPVTADMRAWELPLSTSWKSKVAALTTLSRSMVSRSSTSWREA